MEAAKPIHVYPCASINVIGVPVVSGNHDRYHPRAATILVSTDPSATTSHRRPAMSALQKFMSDWEQEAHRVQEEAREAQKPQVVASVEQEYLDESSREDEGLLMRWTETLNIILTFAGLLAATITSFLLAVQPDLQAAPSNATNMILMQILRQLDNTTVLRLDDVISDSPANTVRVLAWWHASLASSLASAFGALLGKQWVLHYQSIPRWVNTPERQCHVREGRHHGLQVWRFNTILELLPVLLQFSLLLFAIGLADYLSPTWTLLVIITVSIGIVGVFFFVTLLAGVFVPSCPFKTPFTDLVIEVASVVGAWSYGLCYLLPKLLVFKITPARGMSPSTKRNRLQDLKGNIQYHMGRAVRNTLGFKPGSERHLFKDPPVVARLLCWRLQRRLGMDEPEMDGLEDVGEAIMSHPLGAITFSERYAFWYWCDVVIKRLSREDSTTPSSAIDADLLCHILFHIPKSKIAVMQATRAVMGYLAGEQRVMGFLAIHLRRSWGLGTIGILPVKVMRPASITVYLKCQIYRWALVESKKRLHRDLLMDELPLILERDYSPPDFQYTYYQAVIHATTTAAIAMVDDAVPGVPPIRFILPPEPLEQLFTALHRLSHYPIDLPPHKLIGSVVRAAHGILTHEDLRRDLEDCPSWEDGQLSESLLRLMRLGASWWHGEQALWDPEAPGSSLVHDVRQLVMLLADVTAGYDGTTPPWALPSALEDAFAAYSHPSAPCEMPSPVCSLALRYLTYALTSHPRPSPDQYPPPRELQASTPPGTSTIVRRHPQTVSQLIQAVHDSERDPELKPLALSVIVQGRDLFFSPELLPQPSSSPLLAKLESLASQASSSGYAQGIVSSEASSSFDAWDELLQALRSVEETLRSTSGARHGSFAELETKSMGEEKQTAEYSPGELLGSVDLPAPISTPGSHPLLNRGPASLNILPRS